MQLTTTNRLLSAALVAGALFSAPAQAQSSAVTQYKLLVDSTLVLGETTGDGLLRVLNNGPANAEVRWFDPRAGAWDIQMLEAGESLLSERGHAIRVSEGTFVCLLGEAGGKEKAGYRNTSGFYSMPLASTPDKGSESKAESKAESKDKAESKSKPAAESKDKAASKSKPAAESKDKPASKSKPAAESKDKPASKSKPEADSKDRESKSKPEVKTKGGESKSVAALIDEDGDGVDDSGDGESTGITFDVGGHLMVEATGLYKDRGKSSPKIAH